MTRGAFLGGVFRESKPWAEIILIPSHLFCAPLRLKTQVRIGKEPSDQTACDGETVSESTGAAGVARGRTWKMAAQAV